MAMFPPIFTVCAAYAPLTALVGTDPVRVYPFGEAPRSAVPYVTWQTIGGDPENYLGSRPDLDSFDLQLDVYAATPTQARLVAEQLRDAIEPHAYITRWSGESRDAVTKNYRYSFDVDWKVNREALPPPQPAGMVFGPGLVLPL